MIDYPFTEQDMKAAYDEWGCNCGPTSLAFALQIGLDKVRGKIPGFESRNYTNPTMMRAGAVALGAKIFEVAKLDSESQFAPATMFSKGVSLCRIQWTGPWTAPGANAKWAYRQTHWIARWYQDSHRSDVYSHWRVFDCNGGIRSFGSWQKEIVPLLTAMYPRSDGGWHPTHVWRIEP